MRLSRPVLLSATLAVLAAGCGWSPPAPPSTATADCGPGPSPDAVTTELGMLPPGTWHDTARGNTPDCHLYWVVVTSGDAPDSLQQVLFFDGGKAVGEPSMDPRPYISVAAQGQSTAVVQYQWRQGQDQPCCPTGVGTARVTLEDGRLTILDPIPGP
jgi:hypothetical protein